MQVSLPGGMIYEGIVSEATEADGDVYVEFKAGLSPAQDSTSPGEVRPEGDDAGVSPENMKG